MYECHICCKLIHALVLVLNTQVQNLLNQSVTKPVARAESITEGFLNRQGSAAALCAARCPDTICFVLRRFIQHISLSSKAADVIGLASVSQAACQGCTCLTLSGCVKGSDCLQ